MERGIGMDNVMQRVIRSVRRLAALGLATGLGLFLESELRAAEGGTGTKVAELLEQVRGRLSDVDEARLNEIALQAVLKELHPRVRIAGGTNGAAGGAEAPLVAQRAVYEDRWAYIRLGRLGEGVLPALDEAMKALAGESKLGGLILDLRFAGGDEYGAVADMASRFLTEERPLLDWGEGMVSRGKSSNHIELPLMILVNGRTRGAAEALAAVLRKGDAGLVIGRRTAGEALRYEAVTLADGRQLFISKAPVRMGDDTLFPAAGWEPDVEVIAEDEEELAWLQDPYRLPGTKNSGSDGEARQVTAPRRVLRPTNEAELVRQHRNLRSGSVPEEPSVARASVELRILRDPVLVRALDVLKGLAMVQRAKSR